MTGHSPEPSVRAVRERVGRGITLMLPSEDALWVAEDLTRRFGIARWQFALTATDANRFAIRLARAITGRPKVLVHNWCYHGTVDETVATLDAQGRVVPREGSLGPPVRRARRPASSSGTTSTRSQPRSLTRMSPACSRSRRSPTWGSFRPSRATTTRCAT
jgi:glutamate-1-semialdehyde aminotransferase